jgi:ATP-dependent protease ClpP protease subunit
MGLAVYAKLTGKIEKDRGAEIVAWLTTIAPDKTCHLHLLIDSNGGNITAGRTLHSYLSNPKSQVTVYAGRHLSSVAPICFLGADNRALSASTEVIIHRARPADDGPPDIASLQTDNAWMLSVLDERATITNEERDRLLGGEDLTFAAPLARLRGFGQRIMEFAPPAGADISEFPQGEPGSA